MSATTNINADSRFQIRVQPAGEDSLIDQATRDELQRIIEVTRNDQTEASEIEGLATADNLAYLTADNRLMVPRSLFVATEAQQATGPSGGGDIPLDFENLDQLNINPLGDVLILVEALPASRHSGAAIETREANKVSILIRDIPEGDTVEARLWFFQPPAADSEESSN